MMRTRHLVKKTALLTALMSVYVSLSGCGLPGGGCKKGAAGGTPPPADGAVPNVPAPPAVDPGGAGLGGAGGAVGDLAQNLGQGGGAGAQLVQGPGGVPQVQIPAGQFGGAPVPQVPGLPNAGPGLPAAPQGPQVTLPTGGGGAGPTSPLPPFKLTATKTDRLPVSSRPTGVNTSFVRQTKGTVTGQVLTQFKKPATSAVVPKVKQYDPRVLAGAQQDFNGWNAAMDDYKKASQDMAGAVGTGLGLAIPVTKIPILGEAGKMVIGPIFNGATGAVFDFFKNKEAEYYQKSIQMGQQKAAEAAARAKAAARR